MTNELEKTFFDAFGIEPKKQCFNGDCIVKDEIGYDNKICDDRCVYIYKEYPQITDRILLGLICTTKGLVITEDCNSVEQLKDGVLKVLISLAQVNNNIIHQVRTLFEEG